MPILEAQSQKNTGSRADFALHSGAVFEICGQLCLSFLCVVHELGIEAAIKKLWVSIPVPRSKQALVVEKHRDHSNRGRLIRSCRGSNPGSSMIRCQWRVLREVKQRRNVCI